MPEPPTWPPPPNTPEPLSAHDDFLIGCIRNWTPKQPIQRLYLAGKLRDETGLDLRFCQTIVNNFCNRHAILVPPHGLVVWSGIFLPFIMLTMFHVMNFFLDQRHDAAVTHVERVMITAEKRHLNPLFLYICVAVTVVNGVFAFFRDKKTRRQVVEAKEKFA